VAFLRAADDEDIQFQMAPMIDVVFLLLIFFLVATSFINPESQLVTDLPQKRELDVEPEDQPKQFTVMVKRHGIEVNGQPRKKRAFRASIEQLKSYGEVYVFIDSEDEARHRDVVEILDMLTLVGAKVTVVPPYEEN